MSFCWVRVAHSLLFYVVFCTLLHVLFCPIYCLSFIDYPFAIFKLSVHNRWQVTTEERTWVWLRKREHTRGHLWHRQLILLISWEHILKLVTVNQVMVTTVKLSTEKAYKVSGSRCIHHKQFRNVLISFQCKHIGLFTWFPL